MTTCHEPAYRRTDSSSQSVSEWRTSQMKSGERGCMPPIPFEQATAPLRPCAAAYRFATVKACW